MSDTLSRPAKIRRNVTLDPAADAWLDTRDNASATINEMIHRAVEKERMDAALDALIADLDEQYGEPDPAEVARFVTLLGGHG